MPLVWRAWRVDHWVRAADEAEASAKAAALLGRDDWAAQHSLRAIRLYLNALNWRPLAYPVELPAPGEFSAPGHEYMPEARDARVIECVQCGVPIPIAGGQGLYCTACA